MSASLTHMIHDLLTEMSASGCEGGGSAPMASVNSTGSLCDVTNHHQHQHQHQHQQPQQQHQQQHHQQHQQQHVGRSTMNSSKGFMGGECHVPTHSNNGGSGETHDRHSPFTFEGLDSTTTSFEHLTKESNSFQPRDSLLDSFGDHSFQLDNLNTIPHNFKAGEDPARESMHTRSSLLSTTSMPTSTDPCSIGQAMSPPLEFSLFDPQDSPLPPRDPSSHHHSAAAHDLELARSGCNGNHGLNENQTTGLTPFMSGLNFNAYRSRSKESRGDGLQQGENSFAGFDTPEPLSLPPRRATREKMPTMATAVSSHQDHHLQSMSPDGFGGNHHNDASSHPTGVSASLAVSFDLLPPQHADPQNFSVPTQPNDANTLRLDLLEALNEIKQTHDQLPVPAAFQNPHMHHSSSSEMLHSAAPQHSPLYNSVVGLTSSFSHARPMEGSPVRAHKVHHLSLSLDVPPDGITMATVVGPGPSPSPKRAYTAFASSVCTPATAITPVSMSSFAFATPITATAIAKPIQSGERPQKKRRNWRWNRNSTLNTAPRVLMQPHTRYRWKLNHCLEQLRIMTCPAIRDATQYDILSAAIAKLNSLRKEIEMLERGVINSGAELPASNATVKNEDKLHSSLSASSPSADYALSSKDTDSEGEDDYTSSTIPGLDHDGEEPGEQDMPDEGAAPAAASDQVKMESAAEGSGVEGATTPIPASSSGEHTAQAEHAQAVAENSGTAVKSEFPEGKLKAESASTQSGSSTGATGPSASSGSRSTATTPASKSLSLDVIHHRWFHNSEPPRFMLAPDLTFLDVSDSYAADFNLHRNDLRRMRITDLVPAENVVVTCQTFAQVMAEDDYVEVLGFKIVSRGTVILCDYIMWCSISTDATSGARTVLSVQGLQTNRAQP